MFKCCEKCKSPARDVPDKCYHRMPFEHCPAWRKAPTSEQPPKEYHKPGYKD